MLVNFIIFYSMPVKRGLFNSIYSLSLLNLKFIKFEENIPNSKLNLKRLTKMDKFPTSHTILLSKSKNPNVFMKRSRGLN